MPAPKPMGENRPDLISSWHPTLNGSTEFATLISRDPKKYWWTCDNGHDFQATARSRLDGRGCRICLGLETRSGVNDLKTLYPEIASMWHPDKNGEVKPENIGVAGKVSYWWLCPNGHEYRSDTWAKVLGKACRKCSGLAAHEGESDFPTLFPELIDYLDLSLASKSGLRGQHPGSEKVFSWRCREGHTWKQSLRGITTKQLNPCSYCSNKKVWPGFNDLASKNPDLAAQWDFQRNSPATPGDVLYRADKAYWWLCSPHKHSWKVSLYKRAEDGSGCPYCGNYFCLPGFNDIKTLRPDLAAEWDSERNSSTADLVLAGSHKSAFWICSEGHTWKAKPISRIGSENRRGSGCPGCAKSGFDASKPAVLYFLENLELNAYKIGITNEGTSRLFNFKGRGWKIVHSLRFAHGYLAREHEAALQKWLKEELGLASVLRRSEMGRLGGQTETFSRSGVKKSAVLRKFRKIESHLAN